MGPAGNAPQDNGDQFLAIRIGGQAFALSIRAIREIRGWCPVTPLPHAPGYVRGMINLRGNALAILDLARRLGLPAQEPGAASVVVVIEEAGNAAGLVVDAVSEIITITAAMRQPIPDTGDAMSRRFVEGLIMLNDRIMTIISLPAIMPGADILDAAGAAA
jgi:purine-binding chemotaxis protein CheW